MRDERVGDAALDLARPVHDERDARPRLEVAVLAPAERTRRLVVAQLLHSRVAVAVVDDRTVVTGEDDDRAFGQARTIEGFHDLPDGPVGLHDRVPARSETA